MDVLYPHQAEKRGKKGVCACVCVGGGGSLICRPAVWGKKPQKVILKRQYVVLETRFKLWICKMYGINDSLLFFLFHNQKVPRTQFEARKVLNCMKLVIFTSTSHENQECVNDDRSLLIKVSSSKLQSAPLRAQKKQQLACVRLLTWFTVFTAHLPGL